MLKDHFEPVELEFQYAKASDADTTDEIQTFLEESVKDGCEGLMVKMLEGELSHYEPSRRTVNWLKVRPRPPFPYTLVLIFSAPQPGIRRPPARSRM